MTKLSPWGHNINMKTTEEIIEKEGDSKAIAVRWARNNGVRMFGQNYAWTEAEEKAFNNRNRQVGRPKA